MKAVVRRTYGQPEVMELVDVEEPVPAQDEVLVRLRATALNASDWEILTGRPLYGRIWGFFTPKIRILGSDVAGTVEAVGAKVTRFSPGDDLILDLVGHHSTLDFLRALGPAGRYRLVGGAVPLILSVLTVGSLVSLFGRKKMGMLALKVNEGLETLEEHFRSGAVAPAIDATYPLHETPAAMRRLGEGRANGKLVIAMP